jgi:hypothetical protein
MALSMALSRAFNQVSHQSNLDYLIQKYDLDMNGARQCASDFITDHNFCLSIEKNSGPGVAWIDDQRNLTEAITSKISKELHNIPKLLQVSILGAEKIADWIAKKIVDKLSDIYSNPSRYGYPSRVANGSKLLRYNYL